MRLSFPRFGSIRNRILAFAILATLVPSGITMGISYAQNRRALEAKVSQDLVSASSQTARAMGVWLKERLYDLRVFASSEEVANNLSRTGGAPTRWRLNDYLGSLHERFGDFERLAVVDANGRVVGASTRNLSPVRLPERSEWLRALRTQGQLVGDPYWDGRAKKGKLVLAVPVQRADGRIIGAFVAEVNLTPMQRLLREFAHDSSSDIHLVKATGELVGSTEGITAARLAWKVPAGTLQRLSRREDGVIHFTGLTGHDVVGTLQPVPQVGWAVIAERSSEAAYAEIRQARNLLLIVFVTLLVAVGASGYRFGFLIARPLDRLTTAAAEVAAGDLAVDLPEGGSGEVGSLTAVFNHMVSRLREGRRAIDEINETLRRKNEELERLSITDGLTGLANHRFLMQRLKEEGTRANRHNREFCVLMADVDHFKSYNDTFGHPAGDDVLKKVASILRSCTRSMDCAARYGGEEFAVVLPETAIAGAVEVAERIRARVAQERFDGRQITLSLGVAEFPAHAAEPQELISAADRALYEAKHAGRDRVVAAKMLAKSKR